MIGELSQDELVERMIHLEESLTYLKKRKIDLLKEQAKICEYQKNPLLWLEERLGEDPRNIKWSLYPEYANHKWDGDTDPLATAWEMMANKDWVSIKSGSSTGKSFNAARMILWFLDVFENSLVVTSAPKFDQVKLHIWGEMSKVYSKFKQFRPYSKFNTFKLKVDDGAGGDDDATWQAIGFVSGYGTEEQSATKAQGFHRKDMLIVLDETPGMSFKVLTAFENTCTGENNIILALGNPDSENDTLSMFSKHPRVKSIRCSAYDHPNVVLKKEFIGGAVTIRSIEDRKLLYGENADFYKSRVRGIVPKQAENSLIRLEWLEQCIDSDVLIDKDSANALGIDVSNSEAGDKASLTYGRKNVMTDIEEFFCSNASHLAYNLMGIEVVKAAKIKKFTDTTLKGNNVSPDCVGIDGVGVGTSTVQTFVNMGYPVISLQGGQDIGAIPKDGQTGKAMYKFASLRAQMYWQFREDLREKLLCLSIEDKLKLKKLMEQATIPRYEIKGGVIHVESKEEIKKRSKGESPNILDSAVYWNWVRKRRGGIGGGCFY